MKVKPRNNLEVKALVNKSFVMKKTVLIIAIVSTLSVFSCKKDDGVTCTTCSSAETANFQVCEESNGTASVNGQNTGTPYDIYIQGLEEAGASCGN
ncbi:MAG: hypothetical protein ACTIJ9_09295 [Aequorivita sp.]